MIKFLPLVIVVATGLIFGIIVLVEKYNQSKLNKKEETQISRFSGASLKTIKMYKEREEAALRVLASVFPEYSKDKIYSDIDEIVRRLLNAQNNGYISAIAFEKSGKDKILFEIRSMTKLSTTIIGYENNYASVAVIFENANKDLYQLLLRINVSNGIIYLDSYNATIWFNN